MGFLDWCSLFAEHLIKLSEVAARTEQTFISLDQIAKAIFPTITIDLDSDESTRSLAVRQAGDAVRQTSWVIPSPDEDYHALIPSFAENLRAALYEPLRGRSWTSLSRQEERLLLAINRRSERRETDYAYLAEVNPEDLYGDLGLPINHESRVKFERLHRGLQRREFVPEGRAVRAGFLGLAWERDQGTSGDESPTQTKPTRSRQGSKPSPGPSGAGMMVEPIWRGRGFTVDENLCFVLMPFKQPFNTIYEDHIKTTVEEIAGRALRCRRADDIYGVGAFMEDVWEQTCRARFLVAELTDRNPNVFYELGVAHTVGKEVILLAQSMDDVPADLRHQRVIVYDYNPRGVQRLEESLVKTIRAILRLAE